MGFSMQFLFLVRVWTEIMMLLAIVTAQNWNFWFPVDFFCSLPIFWERSRKHFSFAYCLINQVEETSPPLKGGLYTNWLNSHANVKSNTVIGREAITWGNQCKLWIYSTFAQMHYLSLLLETSQVSMKFLSNEFPPFWSNPMEAVSAHAQWPIDWEHYSFV